MPKTIRNGVVGALLMCVVVFMGVGAAAANAKGARSHVHMATQTDKKRDLCYKAESVRREVVRKHGRRAPGRDICRYGKTGGKRPNAGDLSKYLQTLERLKDPPPPVVVSASAVPSSQISSAVYSYNPIAQSSTPATSQSAASSSTLPACASESGTDYSTGPGNTNPSGATGRYQIIPSTHASLCSGLGWSSAEQDQCAARIYKAQGASAWVGCGG